MWTDCVAGAQRQTVIGKRSGSTGLGACSAGVWQYTVYGVQLRAAALPLAPEGSSDGRRLLGEWWRGCRCSCRWGYRTIRWSWSWSVERGCRRIIGIWALGVQVRRGIPNGNKGGLALGHSLSLGHIHTSCNMTRRERKTRIDRTMVRAATLNTTARARAHTRYLPYPPASLGAATAACSSRERRSSLRAALTAASVSPSMSR